MRGEVTSREDCSSLSAFLDGIVMPSLPCCAGRAKRSCSRSLGAWRPSSAREQVSSNTGSMGVSKWPMLGVTRVR